MLFGEMLWFCGGGPLKFNFLFLFLTVASAQQSEQLNFLFSVTSVVHNIFLIHLPRGKHEEYNTQLHHRKDMWVC